MSLMLASCGSSTASNQKASLSTTTLPQEESQLPTVTTASYSKNLYQNREQHFSIIFPDGWEQSGGRGRGKATIRVKNSHKTVITNLEHVAVLI
jgi:hypothetical protein